MDQREVLEKLARGEIDRAEADRLLNQPPAKAPEIPAPPPGKRNSLGWLLGCLIAIAAGAVLIVVAIVLLFFARVQVRHDLQPQRPTPAQQYDTVPEPMP